MKRNTAYSIAIEALAKAQKPYAAGHAAYAQVQGVFLFAKRDHESWERLQEAIKILEHERDYPQGIFFDYVERNRINNEA